LERTKAAAHPRTLALALLLALGALGCAATSAPRHEPLAQPAAATAAIPAPATPAAVTPAAGTTDAATAASPAPDASAANATPTDAAQASTDFDYQPELKEPDPFEPLNRDFFRFNQGLDHVLIGPVARGYAWLVPEPGRRAVRRVFENLDSPVTVANSLLQLQLQHAAVATLRFAMNSTVGVLGLFDPAKALGFEPVEADFGQTLGRLGVGTGPYVVLPLLGPTTARDGIGTFVDSFLRPQTWFLTPAERLVFASSDGITMRDEEGPALEALEDSSVDFYAALRAAYFMHRQAQVDGDEPETVTVQSAPAPAPVEVPPAEVAPAAAAPADLAPSAAAPVQAAASAAPDPGVRVGAPAAQVGAVVPAAPAPSVSP